MSNPWFRMYAEFAHDPKVQMLPEVMQRRYVMLMCMRCSNALVTLQADEIAFHLRIDAAQLEETKALFLAKGFINESWELLNWEKRQFSSDTSAQRVAKHRAAKKAAEEAARNGDVTLPQRKSNAPDTDTDTEKNKEHAPAPGATDAPKKTRKPAKTLLPSDFAISAAVRTWAQANGHMNLQAHFDSFVGKARASGYTYADWDQALQNAIRDDWAKLGTQQRPPPAQQARPSRHSNFDQINYHEGIQDGRIT